MSRLTKCAGVALVLWLGVADAAAPLLSAPPPLLSPSNGLAPLNTLTPVAPINRPELTGVSPSGCTPLAGQLVLSGRNLSRHEGWQLVMDTGRQQLGLSVSSWGSTRISAQLPAQFEHQGKVEIGIRSPQGWQSTPLPVSICRVTTDAPAPQPAALVTSPEGTPPPDPQADNAELPTPAMITSSGSLLGSALPPVPGALQLAVPDQGTHQYAAHELIAVTASMADAQRLAQIMGSYQGRVIRRRKLGSLGVVLSAFRLPDQTSIADTLGAVRRQYPDLWIDVNHYFRPATAADPRATLYRAIARTSATSCGRGLRIGLLDGPVNQAHPALRGQAIEQKVMFARGRRPAPADHATAVASLLVGNPAVAGLAGVVSEARLFDGVVMQQGENDEIYSTAEDLLGGLNWLLEQPVQVISLSLGGPRNALLEVALQRTLSVGIGVVAAAGNGGADAAPSYPAAQLGVVAVTSVDADSRIAADANRGDYIDLAAPGVDVWVASGETGGRYVSGTSMAAPLVAAALAQLGGQPSLVDQLFRGARDLGEAGKDTVYGWGLLQFPGCGKTRK